MNREEKVRLSTEGYIGKKFDTASQAVKSYCLACSMKQPTEVSKCPAEDCHLHSRRNGTTRPRKFKSANQAIKAFCLEQCKETSREVTDCDFRDCELWQFRLGINPNIILAEISDEERQRCRIRLAENLKRPF